MSQTPQPSNEVGEENHQKWVPVVGTSNIGLKSSVFTTKTKGKSKQHRHKTLTLLQYFKTSGFQILIKSRWGIKILVLKCLLQFFTKVAVIVRNTRIARHQRYLKWIFLVFEFSAENSSEEVTLKYGKLCDVCFSFSGWNTTRVFK